MLVEMAVKSMETAVEAMVSMEMAPRALPRPDRVPKQRLLSPKIGLQWQRCCGTVLGKTPIVLGFSVGRPYIGEGASSGGGPGASPHGGAAKRGVRHPRVWLPPGPALALVQSSSFVQEK
jgi:hypothetical protein